MSFDEMLLARAEFSRSKNLSHPLDQRQEFTTTLFLSLMNIVQIPRRKESPTSSSSYLLVLLRNLSELSHIVNRQGDFSLSPMPQGPRGFTVPRHILDS